MLITRALEDLPPRYERICGLTCRNDDGTSREKILKNCKIGEELRLLPHSNGDKAVAVKVCRHSGETLGYLRGVVAADIRKRLEQGIPVSAEIVEFWYQSLFRRVHRGDPKDGKERDTTSDRYLQRAGCFIRVRRSTMF